MPTNKPRPLKELLASEGTLRTLLRRGAACDTLTDEIRRLLPESLRSHVLTASRRDDTLVLVTDGAVWAARLRYHAPELLISQSGLQGRPPQKLKVRVQPAAAAGPPQGA